MRPQASAVEAKKRSIAMPANRVGRWRSYGMRMLGVASVPSNLVTEAVLESETHFGRDRHPRAPDRIDALGPVEKPPHGQGHEAGAELECPERRTKRRNTVRDARARFGST